MQGTVSFEEHIIFLYALKMSNQGRGQGRMRALATPIKPSICIMAPT
jgi:hypothetical protein